MATCYDCKWFGIYCDGLIEPDGYVNRIEKYCARFAENEWREEMFKPTNRHRLS